ncbi:MAG: polyribonucleotide nucleotidyltransferase [Candidatus Komeilibacteria bacterium]
MFNVQTFTREIAGRTLTIETGLLAGQAGGSCTVRYGDTVVLAAACASDKPKEGQDFFPLTVDYEEKFYAAGRIKGSRWIKREGRPSEEAVLTARLIDRSIRPLFSEEERREVQVTITVLSLDQQNDPDMPALIAASCALAMSPMPWNGPVAGMKVGRIENQWVLNPTYEALDKSDLDLIVVGSKEQVVMIEAGAKEIKEADAAAAIAFGHKHIGTAIDLINEVVKAAGKQKQSTTIDLSDEEVAIQDKIKNKVKEYLTQHDLTKLFAADKSKLKTNIENLKNGLDEILKADNEINKEERAQGVAMLNQHIDEAARDLTLAGTRVDGRGYDDVRPLDAKVGILPRTHGSGLFTRGETQVLSIVTLAGPGAEQYLDNIEDEGVTKKRYMHHYNFPGYSVGEVKRAASTNRREIGHGALAEKALVPVLPDKEDFPYTIRVVSEVMSSNGSSSQASICGSTLALMDAGIPIKKAVAGIAMGLITNPKNTEDYRVLTDIQGFEDHAGDMDFKVAGTKDGITALQLDIKLNGISPKVISETLDKAKIAREKILDVMTQAIDQPRTELSKYAPRIETLHIDPEQIRDVIGPGGKIINEIIEKTGVEIDIEQDGTVLITSTDAAGAEKAIDIIKGITKKVKVGEEYEGEVIQIMTDRNRGNEIGAIVQILPNKDGMIHISNLSNEHVAKVSDIVKIGDKIKVKVVEVDEERGRIGLSHKEYMPPASPGQEKHGHNNPRSSHHNNRQGGRDNYRSRR